jgi:hypothetical protein
MSLILITRSSVLSISSFRPKKCCNPGPYDVLECFVFLMKLTKIVLKLWYKWVGSFFLFFFFFYFCFCFLIYIYIYIWLLIRRERSRDERGVSQGIYHFCGLNLVWAWKFTDVMERWQNWVELNTTYPTWGRPHESLPYTFFLFLFEKRNDINKSPSQFLHISFLNSPLNL